MVDIIARNVVFLPVWALGSLERRAREAGEEDNIILKERNGNGDVQKEKERVDENWGRKNRRSSKPQSKRKCVLLEIITLEVLEVIVCALTKALPSHALVVE